MTLLSVVVVAVAVLVVLVNNRAERIEAQSGTTTSTVPGSSEFAEEPEHTDLSALKEANFISITLVEGEQSRSYMIGAGEQDFAALAQSVVAAERVEAPHVLGGSTLTFVLADRRTITFDLDTTRWVLMRGDVTYRPAEQFAEILGSMEEKGK